MPHFVDDRSSLIEDRPGRVIPKDVVVPPRAVTHPSEELLSSLSPMQKFVRQAAAPVAGGAMGGAIGGLPGMMIGAGLGEAANQYLFPEWSGAEKNPLSIALAAGVPALGPVLRIGVKNLPGASFGLQEYLMQELGPKGANLFKSFVRPAGQASKDLWTAVQQTGQKVFVNPQSTQAALAKMEQELGESVFKTGAGVVKRLRTLTNDPTTGGTLFPTFRAFHVNEAELGVMIRSMGTKKSPSIGRAKALYAAMWDDMERTAANTPGPFGQQLQQAVVARKEESALQFLQDAFIKSQSYSTGALQTSVDGILTKLHRNRDVLTRLMSADDLKAIEATLKEFALIPPLETSVQAGVSQVSRGGMIIGGAAGAAVGAGLGGVSGGVAGGLVGLAAIEAITKAVASAPGRAVVRNLARHGLTFDQAMNALSQAGRVGVLQELQVPQLMRQLQGSPEGLR